MRNNYLLYVSVCFLVSSVFAQQEQKDVAELLDEVAWYLYSPEQNRKQSKAFYKEVKSVAETGNADAMYYLGMLQKDGIGTSQNLKKARNSFKKAHELGNTQAAYAVGYFHLKGMGAVPQDYKKAYNWFKKSSEPIATHWRAKMEFLGLGRVANKQKAIKLLASNNLLNSETLLKQYQQAEPPKNLNLEILRATGVDSDWEVLHELKGLSSIPKYAQLSGDWKGEFIELDWSASKVLRVLPVSVSLKKDGGVNQSFKTTIAVGDSIANSSATYTAGSLRFEELIVPVKKEFRDYDNFTHLQYDISGLECRYLNIDGQKTLLARVDGFLPVWKERMTPTLLVIKKEAPEIDEATLKAFEEQSNDFLKIYPNPFREQFLLNFELPRAAQVTVEIRNYYGTGSYGKVFFKGRKSKGEHTLEITDPPTASGSYFVLVSFNGKTERKIIINQ